MLELNKIYCENCLDTIKKMEENEVKCDIVLTSPPYNVSHHNKSDKYAYKYNKYDDTLNDEEYITKTIHLFSELDKVLVTNGVILYNLSYSVDKSSLYLKTIFNIIEKTNFELVDTIIWKKKQCIPDNRSSNRLSRIVEFIFILVRKEEIKTFTTNKKLKSVAKSGAKNYEPLFNFIEAKNNDGNNNLNKATFSTDLCLQLLNMYANSNMLIYDPFIGIGTTAIAALKCNCKFIGSEIDNKQVEYANKKIEQTDI